MRTTWPSVKSDVQTEPAAGRSIPDPAPTETVATGVRAGIGEDGRCERYPFYVMMGAEGPSTPTGLAERPAFRSYAEAVEARLCKQQVDALTSGLAAARQAIDDELAARSETAAKRR